MGTLAISACLADVKCVLETFLATSLALQLNGDAVCVSALKVQVSEKETVFPMQGMDGRLARLVQVLETFLQVFRSMPRGLCRARPCSDSKRIVRSASSCRFHQLRGCGLIADCGTRSP